jgi:hypothetical protein
MKRISIVFFFVAVFCSLAAAQSVVVTSHKVTYTRKKPLSEYKKTFTINYPKIKAGSPAISRRIEDAASYRKVLGLMLNEELNQYQWLEEADYEIEYNKNNLLGLKVWMEGSGAYPDGVTKYVVVDTRTGQKLRPADLFTDLPGLFSIVKKAQAAEIANAKRENKDDREYVDSIDQTLTESRKYHPLKLDQFSISATGVTFHHDYDFAHVIQAMEPDGEYFFTWKQLRPYIKPGSLLSRIAR